MNDKSQKIDLEQIIEQERLAIEEKHRANEYWELGGDEGPIPYPELAHAHDWNKDGYCTICGADGAA